MSLYLNYFVVSKRILHCIDMCAEPICEILQYPTISYLVPKTQIPSFGFGRSLDMSR